MKHKNDIESEEELESILSSLSLDSFKVTNIREIGHQYPFFSATIVSSDFEEMSRKERDKLINNHLDNYIKDYHNIYYIFKYTPEEKENLIRC